MVSLIQDRLVLLALSVAVIALLLGGAAPLPAQRAPSLCFAADPHHVFAGLVTSGDLRYNASLVLTEAVIALVLIRPWSYARSWGRALAGAILFAPWVLLNLLFLIHSGGIMVLHTVWLLALWVSFVGAAARSGGASMMGRARQSADRTVRGVQ